MMIPYAFHGVPRVNPSRKRETVNSTTPHSRSLARVSPCLRGKRLRFARGFAVFVMSVILPLAGAAEQPVAATPDSWPISRGDAALTGTTPARVPDQPVLRWHVDLGSKIVASPVIHDGTVYAASLDGAVVALRLRDGERRWQFETPAGIEGSPLVAGGVLYIGDLEGKLHALDAETGQPRWHYVTEGRIMGGVNRMPGDPSLVLVGSYDDRLHAVDAATGTRVWIYETGHYVHGTPALAGDVVLIGGCDEHVHGARIEDGRGVVKLSAGSHVAASPAIRDAYAYVGHYHGEVLAMNWKENKIRWRFAPSDHDRDRAAFYASPAVTATRVLAGDRDGFLYALARDSGKEVWRFRARRDIDGSPVVARDRVLFGSRDGRLYMLSFSDGELLWSYHIGSPVNATLAVVDDWIVAGAHDGSLYAFGKGETENHRPQTE